MIGFYKADQRKHHRFYYCRKHKSQGNCIKNLQEADILEEKVLSILEKKLTHSSDKIIDQYLKIQEKNFAERNREIEVHKKELQQIQKGIDNLLDAIQQGLPPVEIKERLGQLTGKKKAKHREIQEMEKSHDLDMLLGREALKLFVSNLSDFIKRGRDGSPEELQQWLKYFVQITFNAETKEGRITIFLPQEIENPIKFDTGCDNRCLNINRSG